MNYNLEAENALIGCAIHNLPAVDCGIRPDEFYNKKNSLVWAALKAIKDAGQDSAIVYWAAHEIGTGVDVRGLLEYSESVWSKATPDSYAVIIRGLALKRQVIAVLQNAVRNAETVEPQQGIENTIADLRELSAATSKCKTLTDAITTQLDIIESGVQPKAVYTSAELDGKLNGLHAGRLYVVAARPSMGKSAIALWLATLAIKNGHSVHFWTLEMLASEFAVRYLSSQMKQSLILKDDVKRARIFQECTKQFAPLALYEQATATVADIFSATRAARPSMVVVDHMGLLQSPDRSRSREQDVSEFSRGLKRLAMEFEIPVVALCQLNREVQKRDGNKPQLSDLRDSGTIEENADAVLMLYRDNYYNGRGSDTGDFQILIRKNRGGALGQINLMYDPGTSQFWGEHSQAPTTHGEIAPV